ncbi:MAG: hypothetical protein ACK56I_29275, partial [bacterium]
MVAPRRKASSLKLKPSRSRRPERLSRRPRLLGEAYAGGRGSFPRDPTSVTRTRPERGEAADRPLGRPIA